MRSPDQFLGIRARLAFEAAGKAIGIVLQRAALGRNCALAVLDAALPFDRSECRRHGIFLFVCRAPTRRDPLFQLSTFPLSIRPLFSLRAGQPGFDKHAISNRETISLDRTYLEHRLSGAASAISDTSPLLVPL